MKIVKINLGFKLSWRGQWQRVNLKVFRGAAVLVSSPFAVVEVSDDRYVAGRERTTMNLHLQPVSRNRKYQRARTRSKFRVKDSRSVTLPLSADFTSRYYEYLTCSHNVRHDTWARFGKKMGHSDTPPPVWLINYLGKDSASLMQKSNTVHDTALFPSISRLHIL
jgi:hypothetical protein